MATEESRADRRDPGSGAAFARLYYVHPLLVGAMPRWPAIFAHAQAMGFDRVLVAPLFAPGAAGDVFLSADPWRLNSALAFDGDADAGIARLAEMARQHGLGLCLDLVLDRVASDSRLCATHDDWFSDPAAHELPDPRRPPPSRHARAWRLQDPQVAAHAEAFWRPRLLALAAAGVAGFRCELAHRAPAALWRQLIGDVHARHPACRFMAWTPGAAPPELAALCDCGFDGVFLSTCWWDFRSDWYAEEYRRCTSVARPLAPVEVPFGRRVADGYGDAGQAERAARRVLRLAATSACGYLLPMGFEFGARQALHPALGAPDDLVRLRHESRVDLTAEIARLNDWASKQAALAVPGELRLLTGTHASASVLLRGDHPDSRFAHDALLVIANPDVQRPQRAPLSAVMSRLPASGAALRTVPLDGDTPAGEVMAPGAVRVLALHGGAPIVAPQTTDDAAAAIAAARAPRFAVEAVSPAVDGGRFPVKRLAGEAVRVEADLIADGHTQVAAALRWRPADDAAWRETRMRLMTNDRWYAEFTLERVGRYEFAIEVWLDGWGTLCRTLRKKYEAGQGAAAEIDEALQWVRRAAARSTVVALRARRAAGRVEAASGDDRVRLLLSDEIAEVVAAVDTRPFLVRSDPYPVEAERQAAVFASWYELFPRSMSNDPSRHGTFDDVIARLPAIRDMGFDALYFPPIHPIGRTARKGRNNALKAGPDEPGSPYAIGAAEGGHTAIHPSLGTIDDFRRLRRAAEAHGLELALDFAIQCSRDHPWLGEHPEWFHWKPDGTIAFAENPPKKYEDIVNVEFYDAPGAGAGGRTSSSTTPAPAGPVPALWLALRDVVAFWMNEGVRLFRVDNPHTKPLPFWEWLIADIRRSHPDVIFLSEAFTRPKIMNRLAKVGFSQSYTYFTWRHGKHELTEYLVQLTQGPEREYFRPHFFVNTPDINPLFLQASGRPGFLIRAALATTLSGLWGMYSGFELCEAAALPGKEEYADSEKYQLRAWDWSRPGNIVAEITQLNRLRRTNPALQSHLGLTFYDAFDDHILYFGKATRTRDNVVLVAINLDPAAAHDCDFEIPLWEWGLPDDGALEAEDLLHGNRFTWRGKRQRLRLEPHAPYALWRVQPIGGGP